MSFVRRITVAVAFSVAILAGCGLFALPARAGFIVTMQQVGVNVVATGSGTLNLAGLSLCCSGGGAAVISPSEGTFFAGVASGGPPHEYGFTTGPISFGSGSFTFADSASGDLVGIYGQTLYVPFNYASNGALADSATYDNATFISLGVTPGTYEWTWGSGDDQFLRLLIVAPTETSVPEPSSLVLMMLPLGFLMLLAARNHPRAMKA